MTGWRIGYACANDVIAKVMANYVSHSTGSPVAISQRAAAVALSGSQAEIETMRQAFEQRRNYIVERMNAIPGVSCIQPEGGVLCDDEPGAASRQDHSRGGDHQ